MTDVWVCTNCKSINRQRDTRCYSCGQRQEVAAAAAEQTPNVRLAEAAAQRQVRGYTPSLPFAVAAGVLISVVAVMGVWLVLESLRGADLLREAFIIAIRSDDSRALDPLLAEQQRLAGPSLMRAGLLFLAVIAFGLWLRQVRLNIPALGGGEPDWGPTKALLYPLIPIVNVFRVPVYVQDALYRLDPKAGGFLMVMAAFLLFLGSWLVGFVGGLVISGAFVNSLIAAAATEETAAAAFGTLLDQTMVLTVITELMTATGALLLVVIVARVESRAQARNREIDAGITGDPSGAPASTGWRPPGPKPAGPAPTQPSAGGGPPGPPPPPPPAPGA
ncbi:MAG TPA: DUF4328 domain-containing protein [Candidatus Limnocylindrales bacterium]|nr:DUF4328 domain-containing protein [Candidatus Limnocylindrales bacterium]